MSITPTKLSKANKMATKVAVYDADQKKPILVFKSRGICADYLFSHRIQSINDKNSIAGSIRYWVEKKITNDGNVFARRLAFRSPNESMIQALGDNDFVVLDDEYRSEDFEVKHNSKPAAGGMKRIYNEYGLESILEIGDEVELIYGSHKGYTSRIIDIKRKSAITPGTKYYTISIRGTECDFKCNVLQLVNKVRK